MRPGRDPRHWRSSLRFVIVASIAFAGLWFVATGVQAQSDSDSSQNLDHYYFQFFGYARDVTVDGEALQAGDSITPILNGEAVKPAQVQDNGFFLTFRHDISRPAIGDCRVVYLVHSQRHARPLESEEFRYPKGCGDIQVRLTLSTADMISPDRGNGTEQVSAEQQESEDLMQSDAEQSELSEAGNAESDDDLMQDEAAEDELEQSAEPSQAEPAPERHRPNAPSTGSGGLTSERTETNWSLVAGTFVLLGAMITGAMLMMRRRKDQSPR